MITEEFTVTSKRLSIHENEAELTQRPEFRVIGQRQSHARIGSITITGPAADELNLGQRLKLTIEKVVEIPVGLRAYKPQVYRGFIITDENDGRWRFYLDSKQIGWADSLERCKGLIDAQVEQTA